MIALQINSLEDDLGKMGVLKYFTENTEKAWWGFLFCFSH